MIVNVEITGLHQMAATRTTGPRHSRLLRLVPNTVYNVIAQSASEFRPNNINLCRPCRQYNACI